MKDAKQTIHTVYAVSVVSRQYVTYCTYCGEERAATMLRSADATLSLRHAAIAWYGMVWYGMVSVLEPVH